MAKIRKRRIRWSGSHGSKVVGYKLYWAVDEGVNYDSDCSEIGNVTEVVLPDNVPSFPLVAGTIELGVTSINEVGNESDMTKLSTPFEFSAPDAPRDLVVEPIQDFHVDSITTESGSGFEKELGHQERWGS